MRTTARGPSEVFPATPVNLAEVCRLFGDAGCHALYVKEMAWNHDAKRQVYLTSDLSAFNIFPNRTRHDPPMPPGLVPSAKPGASRGVRIHGDLDFRWVTDSGATEAAPSAKIIYYPQYPEVRLSGFLRGVSIVPSRFLQEKSGEVYPNRLLFLGTRSDGATFAFLVVGDIALRAELWRQPGYDPERSLNQLELRRAGQTGEERLLARLSQISGMGWVSGRRLSRGVERPCTTPQAVGYTLEALLGISANGDNAPDFEGFEVKAMTVPSFGGGRTKPVTVFTPEPDLGVYRSAGVREFLRRWGYADQKGRPDRRNFGGIHKVSQRHHRTGLTLRLVGFDPLRPDRIDPGGSLILTDDGGGIAAGWSFGKLVDRWSRKHAAAVYVPAIRDAGKTRFRYGNEVSICRGTDLLKVLAALAAGKLYLDPAVKAENWNSGDPAIHPRNQFRIRMCDVPILYASQHSVTL